MADSPVLDRQSVTRASRSVGFVALLSRLSAQFRLSQDEVCVLDELGRQTRAHGIRTEIWRGGRASRPRIMVTGWACRQRILGDGRRQIIDFVLPGDAVSDWAQPCSRADASTMALTEVVTADATALVAAATSSDRCHSGLARLLREMATVETNRLHNQIVRLGRQTAYERMVHLMLEFHSRLQAVGLASEDRFAMPLTQETLADSVGLSVVHVNRTLMQMRRDGLMHLGLGKVKIVDLDLMQAVADWMPTDAEVSPTSSNVRRESLRFDPGAGATA